MKKNKLSKVKQFEVVRFCNSRHKNGESHIYTAESPRAAADILFNTTYDMGIFLITVLLLPGRDYWHFDYIFTFFGSKDSLNITEAIRVYSLD